LRRETTLQGFKFIGQRRKPLGINYGYENFYSVLRHAIASTDHLQKRLAGVISGIDHLEQDSFPDDETWNRFEKLVNGTTMLPPKGNEGTIQATTSQMTDDEAALWLKEAFDIFSNIAEVYGRAHK
jgi:hypothetical protein